MNVSKNIPGFLQGLILAALGCVLVFPATGQWGCATGQYGRLRTEPEVTRMFTSNDLPGDFNYYINGRSSMPYAIIGLDPRYELASDFWEPVDPDRAEFGELIDLVWDPHVWYQYDPARGAWIIGPDGEKVGIWYSMYPSTTVIVEGRQVSVFSPMRPSEE